MRKYLVIHLLFYTGSITAQHPLFQSISTQQGLPSNVVYSINQDSKGFIWVAHDKGLSRYDGKEFQTYTHPAMKGIAVTDIFEDKKARLWCRNFMGQHFYMFGDSMHYAESILPTGDYYQFFESSKGDFYNASSKEIRVYDSELKLKDSIVRDDYINSFLLINDTLHFFTEKKLFRYENNTASALYETPSGHSYMSTFAQFLNKNLYVFSRSENAIIAQRILPAFEEKILVTIPAIVQTVNVTNDSLVWVNTTGGTYLFDSYLNPLPGPQPLFPGKSISCVFRDRMGAYWITTTDEGIFYMHDIETLSYSKTGESFSSICVNKTNNLMYTGSNTGKIYSLNETTGDLTLFANTGVKHAVFPLTWDEGGNMLLAQGKSLTAFRGKVTVFEFSIAAKDVFVLNKDEYLTAASGTISIVAKTGNSILKKWRSIATDLNTQAGYSNLYIDFGIKDYRAKAIEYDRETETIYAGTSKGLWSISSISSREILIDKEQIVTNDLEWMGDTLCVSTFNHGILFIYQTKIVYSLTSENSILKKTIDKIKYHNGTLWATSENRLFCITMQNEKFNVSEKTGLGSEEFKDLAFYNGKIFAAVQSNIIAFPEENRFQEPAPIRLYIEKLFCNGSITDTTLLYSLSYKQNNLKIEFAVPYFGNNELPDIYYNINNNGWKLNEKGSRILNLLSLSPGDYAVQLKATNDAGNSSEIKTVRFSIAPTFWQTGWFIFLLLIISGLCFYGLYLYRLSFVEKQNSLLSEKINLEKELHQSMLASIKSQMNPHFIFNSLNTIQSYIYLNDKQNASGYLGKFSQLTRMVLDMSNSETVSLKDELEALTLYLDLEKMRFEESLEFKIETEKGLDVEGIKIPSMLIQPYIENAVKHGLLHKKENRRVTCSFSREENNLIVTIDDNGIGRKRSGELNAIKQNKHQSFSTEANKKRLEILNKEKNNTIAVEYIDKMDDAMRSTGTSVILRIPIKNNIV